MAHINHRTSGQRLSSQPTTIVIIRSTAGYRSTLNALTTETLFFDKIYLKLVLGSIWGRSKGVNSKVNPQRWSSLEPAMVVIPASNGRHSPSQQWPSLLPTRQRWHHRTAGHTTSHVTPQSHSNNNGDPSLGPTMVVTPANDGRHCHHQRWSASTAGRYSTLHSSLPL